MQVKAGMVKIVYFKASEGKTKTYIGIENPDQTNNSHLGLVIADSDTLREYLDEFGTYQERKANGRYKGMFRRFKRDEIQSMETLSHDEAKERRKEIKELRW